MVANFKNQNNQKYNPRKSHHPELFKRCTIFPIKIIVLFPILISILLFIHPVLAQQTQIEVKNSLNWQRSGPVDMISPFPGKAMSVVLTDNKGKTSVGQVIADTLYFTAKDVMPQCSKIYTIKKASSAFKNSVKVSNFMMENQFYKIKVDKNRGFISSIYDKTSKREILREGGNGIRLQVVEKTPDGKTKIIELANKSEVVIMNKGPVKALITFDQEYKNSQINVDIILYDAMPLIYINITSDWQENLDEGKPISYLRLVVPSKIFGEGNIFSSNSNMGCVEVSDVFYSIGLLNKDNSNIDFYKKTFYATVLESKLLDEPITTESIFVLYSRCSSNPYYDPEKRFKELLTPIGGTIFYSKDN